ncbi:AAA family ATPase, partial [Ruminococcus sp.]
MDFKLKDLGKIKKADIKLDGITVICGDNNTGKSTIGKSLFSFYNALYDYKTKISMQKDSRFKNFILSNINSMDVPVRLLDNDSTMSFITSQAEDFSVEDVKKYLEENYPIKVTKNKVASLVEYLNLPEKDILNEYVFRYFNLVMNGQIKNLNSTGKSSVTAEIKGKSDT